MTLLLSSDVVAQEAMKIPTSQAMSAVVVRVEPVYPAFAKQMKLAGRVEILATISEDGSVTTVETVSGNPVLARSAMDAVKRWRFKPFKDDGRSIKAVSTFTLDFKL